MILAVRLQNHLRFSFSPAENTDIHPLNEVDTHDGPVKKNGKHDKDQTFIFLIVKIDQKTKQIQDNVSTNRKS